MYLYMRLHYSFEQGGHLMQDGGLLNQGYGADRNAPYLAIISLCLFPAVATQVKVLLLKKTGLLKSSASDDCCFTDRSKDKL